MDKAGKVLAAEPGGPQATVDVVANLVKEGKVGTATNDNAATADAIQTSAAEAPVTDKEDPAALAAPAEAVASEQPPKFDEAPLETTPSKDEAEAAKTASEVADSATAAKLDVSATGTPAAETAAAPATANGANGDKLAVPA